MYILSTTYIFTKNNEFNILKNKIFENNYVISNSTNTFKNIEFNGAGIFNNKLVSNEENYDNIFEDYLTIEKIETLQFNMSGALCSFLKCQSNEQFFILPDPLGTAILFYYDSPKYKIFSNSIKNIIQVLDSIGVKVDKNPEFMLENLATTNGGLIQSPYKNIHALKPYQYVMTNKDGAFIQNNSKVKYFLDYSEDVSVDEVVTQLKTDLLSNLEISSKYNTTGYKICHLTGGFDSRLVLAGILASGYKDDYLYYCSGRKGTLDKDISINLSKHFGLTQTNFSGYYTTESATTFENKLLRELNYSDGLSLNVHEYYKKENNFIVGGAYGGLVRSYFGSIKQPEQYNEYNELIFKVWPNLDYKSNNNILKSDFVKSFENNFKQILLEGNELGLDLDAALDYYYLRIRNRYHFGTFIFNQATINPRFDPLYSHKSALMSLKLEKEIRKSNVIGLEVMKQLNSELIRLPFDKPKVSEKYQEIYGEVKPLEFENNYGLIQNNRELPKIPDKPANKKGSKDDLEKANKLKVHLWQLTEMDTAQNGLKKIMTMLPTDFKNEKINKDYIESLLNKKPNTRKDIRNLHNLYANFIWYTN